MSKLKEMSASAFKAKCLKLMDQVAESGEPIVITKNGEPVAQLVPAPSDVAKKSAFGFMRGKIAELEPIDWSAPAAGPEDWPDDKSSRE